MNLFFYGFLTILLTIAQSSMALEGGSLEIIPAKAVPSRNNGLFISYSMPCGMVKKGLVHTISSPGIMKIGIVMERKRILCASMPRLRVEKISFINTNKVRKFLPFEMSPASKIFLSPVGDISLITQARSNHPRLQVVHEESCTSSIVGLFTKEVEASRNSSNEMQLGFIEVQDQRFKNNVCAFHQKVFSINYLVLDGYSDTKSIRPKIINPYFSYNLEVRSINPGKIKKSQTGGVLVNFPKRCNERPVGLLLGIGGDFPAKHPSTNKVRLGILVARYYNIHCKKTSERDEQVIMSKAVFLGPNKKVESFPDDHQFAKFQLRSPAKILSSGSNFSGLKILHGCSKPLAIVVGNNDSAIGVLEEKSFSTCLKKIEFETVSQVAFNPITSKVLYPLRLGPTGYF